MRLTPSDNARRRIPWTGSVDSSSGRGLNCVEKVAPPRPSGGRVARVRQEAPPGPGVRRVAVWRGMGETGSKDIYVRGDPSWWR